MGNSPPVVRSPLIDFAGNDYLGLARDPRLAEALCRAAREDRISATSSRWGLGWTAHHERLEIELAEFFGAEAACILGAAYFGGLVYFTTMAERCETVYCDANSHSNLFLGMKAAGLRIVRFAHLDLADLREKIADDRSGRAIVASDSVFGISGELADLGALQEIARAHDAELFIDDAHGVFGMGATGRGAIEACGIELDERTALLGSMSKALGVNGGFLVGQRDLVEWFRRNPTASGSAVPPIPIAAACVAAIRIVRDEPELRRKLAENGRRMRDVLAEVGIETVCDRTPVVAMILADEFEAARLDRHFRGFGLRIPYFKYASEPRENLLRGVTRACYTESDLNTFAAAIREWRGG